MQWFTEVNDAINTLQNANEDLVLVVSVEDNAESENLNLIKKLETSLSDIFSEPKFVGLRVPTSSVLHRQLSAIYHVIPVPCLFFIRGDGQPIDVIQNLSEEEIQPRIVDVVDSVTSYLKKNLNSRLGDSTSKQEVTLMDGENITSTMHVDKNSPQGSIKGKVTAKQRRLQGVTGDRVPTEACLDSEGRDEAKDEATHGSTSSEGDAEEWKYVGNFPNYGAQGNNLQESWSLHGNQFEQPTTSGYARSARIQFRLPSGESHTHEFRVNTTVRELYDYVGEYIDLPFNYWTLALVFPRRELDVDSGDLTVTDLGLVPNGVVLIVPRNGDLANEGFLQEASNLLLTIFARPLSMAYSLWSYVYSYIFPENDSFENLETEYQEYERFEETSQYYSAPARVGPPSRNLGDSFHQLTPSSHQLSPPSHQVDPPPPELSPLPPPSSSELDPPPLMPPPMQSPASIMRDGNVHRLTFQRRDDDDDDTNTWNGNSTQQM